MFGWRDLLGRSLGFLEAFGWSLQRHIYDFHHQKVLLIVINLILSFLLIVNILLLFGTTKEKHMFLLPWLVFHMMLIMVS